MTARRTCIYIHISKGLGDFQDLNIDLHIKCYDDVKFTRNSYLGDMFNNSRTIKIIEFDNFKYNLNYPTNRNKAAISIVILLLANFAVCIVVYRIKWPAIQFCRKIQKQHTKSLKVTNRNDNLIKDGTEIRRYVRIQVIGKDGVGKSSLVRRLVGDSNMKVHSTDGIDIVKKCQIRTTDGKWIIGRVETERKKIINRILDTLHREQKQGELVSDQVIPSEKETNVKDIIPSKGPLSEIERKLENQPATVSIDKSSTNENKVNITETATSVAEKSNIDKPIKDSVILSTNDFQKSADSIKIDDMRKKIFEQMDEILVKVQKDQDQMTSERLVECGIWDFAGQKDYYATHQTFLNPHAIYLLVTNISDDIAATEDNTNFDSIEEYIDFWFDSIHCLRTSSPGHGLNPPVIVVCTHIDEYKTEKEVEDRKKEYIKRFKKCFGGQDKANHNRGIYFISNTEFLKSDFNKLKNKISDVAKEMMYFTEELPMQWIQLENALSVLKDESKQNILSWQTCVELAEMLSIKENELLPFLTYQHNIGNIIFFADIKEYIILQPDWLVKCFRYTVCEKAGQKTLYRGKTLVNLDKTGLRKLCICFSKNAIAFQVLTLSDVKDNIYNTILGELCKKIEELKERLGQSISCDIKAKCSNGDYSNKEGRMTFEELGEMCENGHYLCPEHNEMHSKDDVEKTWLQHADIVIAKLNKEQAENNPRNIVENETSKEETFIHDQASVKNNLPVSVTLRKQLNIKQSTNEDLFITSCIKTGNTLVFTDCDNKRLIICNSDGTDIHHIPLSDKPDYITEIDSNTVAVSCRYDRTILIINISTRSVTSRIKTSGICREYHIMIISCTLLFMGV
ncbi:Hypothetical predicted protein [Mytilus galloprovincialis]|uniref:non-specific serine/threonine protein kinase n=1 Tax=Mytilus galloprovincialis TaxID=29158 RepID=A0A8B6BPR5_MYTGA|nr:Hypothetical predicted protein [Mytilus galloprovincialis]